MMLLNMRCFQHVKKWHGKGSMQNTVSTLHKIEDDENF